MNDLNVFLLQHYDQLVKVKLHLSVKLLVGTYSDLL